MARYTQYAVAAFLALLTSGCTTSTTQQQALLRSANIAPWATAEHVPSPRKPAAVTTRQVLRPAGALEHVEHVAREDTTSLSLATPFFDTSRRPHDRDWPPEPSAFRQVEQEDETGTDPRGFGTKFMPYFRYTELENGIEVQELTLFGMIGFSKQFAMTYEFPIMKQIDYTSLLPVGPGGFPPGNGTPLPTGGGVPTDLEADGDNTGMGDLILRAFYWPESWDWNYADDNNIALIPIWEMTLPTATDDVLGGKTWVGSPGFALVVDIPGDPPFGLGFLALMNFYDFDITKDNGVGNTSRFRGRWFWMQPLTKPGPEVLDGLYVLTEAQPVFDFVTDDFSFWIGPEFGKMLSPGRIIYVKPGWGIDPDASAGDRDMSFEVGFRYFF